MKTLLIGVVLGMALFVMPAATQAAGLIPCGGEGEHPCQSCDVVTLANNVIGWLVGALGLIAILIITYAGVKLVTANGNHHAMEEAKGMMTNLIIGYLIVLAAWLAMDYILKALLASDTTSFGPWNTIQCVKQPEVAKVKEWSDPGYLLAKVEGWTVLRGSDGSDQFGGGTGGSGNGGGNIMTAKCTVVSAGPVGTPVTSCTAKINDCKVGGGIPTISPSGDSVICKPSLVTSRPPDLSAGGACAASVVQPYFGELTGAAQCIIQHESVCGARMVSRTDVMRDGRAFSFGPMQINITYHDLVGCGPSGSTLPCTEAFNGRNYSATVKNEVLYQACARAAQSIACNLRNGRMIHDQRGGWKDWSTAASCGLR